MTNTSESTPVSPESAATRPAWRVWAEIAIWAILFFAVKATVVEAYRIPSASMENSLLIGDFVVGEKLSYGGELPFFGIDMPALSSPQQGDIVVFLYPGDRETKYIKRCVAVGGDTVEVIDKVLYVNGREVPDAPDAKYTDTTLSGDRRIQPRPSSVESSRDNFGPFVVPLDSYFMMGDNRDNSFDSRYWGPVPDELIISRAVVVHFSWDDETAPSPAISLRDPLSVPRSFVFNAVHFFQKVRWSRLLHYVG